MYGVVYPCDCVTDWELSLAALPSIMRVLLPIASSKRNSKLATWFLLNAYGFHTTLKHRKSNHGKLGTACAKEERMVASSLLVRF